MHTELGVGIMKDMVDSIRMWKDKRTPRKKREDKKKKERRRGEKWKYEIWAGKKRGERIVGGVRENKERHDEKGNVEKEEKRENGGKNMEWNNNEKGKEKKVIRKLKTESGRRERKKMDE